MLHTIKCALRCSNSNITEYLWKVTFGCLKGFQFEQLVGITKSQFWPEQIYLNKSTNAPISQIFISSEHMILMTLHFKTAFDYSLYIYPTWFTVVLLKKYVHLFHVMLQLNTFFVWKLTISTADIEIYDQLASPFLWQHGLY